MTAFKPGDEVYGYSAATTCSSGPTRSTPPPPTPTSPTSPTELSFEEAAALPLAGLTAHQALETMGVRGGETLFVGGGSGASATSPCSSRSPAARA